MFILCSFTKLYIYIDEKYFKSYKNLLAVREEMIISSQPHLVKCVVIKIMFEMKETYLRSLYVVRGVCEHKFSRLSFYPVFFLVLH